MRIVVRLLSGAELRGVEFEPEPEGPEAVKAQIERILSAEGQGFLVVEGERFHQPTLTEEATMLPVWHCIPTRSIDYVTVQ